jgi:hypothetical protein
MGQISRSGALFLQAWPPSAADQIWGATIGQCGRLALRPLNRNVCWPHASLGSVFVVNPDGEPIARVLSPRGKTTTNVKFGGPDRKTMFITESSTGSILSAPWTTPGRKLYAEMGGVP